jgi:diacylglycerol kinase (ATP)
MQIHCVAAVAVVAAGLWFSLATYEWMALVFCNGLVLSAECMNTALERLADRVCRQYDPLIKHAKDCGSAAVLMVVLMAVAVGAIVFLPKISAIAR